MTNPEIRKKALSKVRVRHLTFLVVISYALLWLSRLTRGLTGNALMDAAIGGGVALVLSLIAPAGLARASMTAWRHGEAKFAPFFGSFYRPRLFLRGVALGLVVALYRFCLSFLLTEKVFTSLSSLPGQGLWIFPIAFVVLVPFLFAWLFLYFASELMPDVRFGAVLARGVSVIVHNIGRILKMELALLWWIALALFATVAISMLSGLVSPTLDVVMLLVSLTLTWMIGAYVCLANAGLARELFKS